jgi:tetratricopeptide (TPR) repeat protein
MRSFAELVGEFEAAGAEVDPLLDLAAAEAMEDTLDDEAHGEQLDSAPYPDELQKASFFEDQGEYALAVRAYLNVLNNLDATEEQQKRALLGLASSYFARGSMSRAVHLLEKYMFHFPDDPRRPEILFQLGLLYREMELNEESIAVFYRVLNAIVVTGEADLPKYLAMARRAQFEIARSHFDNGDYDQALALFDRIDLFELNRTDPETLHYYQALATLRSGDLRQGLRLLNTFLRSYTDSPLLPEMHFTKAETLFELQQGDDAVSTLMQLLEVGGLPGDDAGEDWSFWRKQAGNRFANRFYESRDFLAALRIYQGMVPLEDSPEWQLPIIYQIGLCFERLGMFARAIESYDFVIKGIAAVAAEGNVADNLSQLRRNAAWRLDMLAWREQLENSFTLPNNPPQGG